MRAATEARTKDMTRIGEGVSGVAKPFPEDVRVARREVVTSASRPAISTGGNARPRAADPLRHRPARSGRLEEWLGRARRRKAVDDSRTVKARFEGGAREKRHTSLRHDRDDPTTSSTTETDPQQEHASRPQGLHHSRTTAHPTATDVIYFFPGLPILLSPSPHP